MLSFIKRDNYITMSSQEEGNKDTSTENLPALKGEPIKPKAPSKAIRLLTVIAYVLSVSMAAIFLSIYYIFIWKDKTLVSAETLNYTAASLNSAECSNISKQGSEDLKRFTNETMSPL